MINTKIRFKYCTEENVNFIVKLPKEINMTDIIEVLGNDEATIENIEEVIELLGGLIIDTEIGDTNELFSLEEIALRSENRLIVWLSIESIDKYGRIPLPLFKSFDELVIEDKLSFLLCEVSILTKWITTLSSILYALIVSSFFITFAW